MRNQEEKGERERGGDREKTEETQTDEEGKTAKATKMSTVKVKVLDTVKSKMV